MSDYAFVADRARKAFSSVARLERALEKTPGDRGIQTNLLAMRKLADQAQNELLRLAEINKIEVCNYRLVPEPSVSLALPFISRSFLSYQNLFSQIYDAIRNGVLKERAVIGKEAEIESMLEFGYSYSGSLGVVLLAQSERNFFDGNLDKPIEALFQVLDIKDNDTVRDVAHTLGNAVVKRVFDWSEANILGGFSADVRWTRSDGRQLGQMVERRQMEKIVDVIKKTADESSTPLALRGMLVGADLAGRTFHFVVPDGEAYKGPFHKELEVGPEIVVGKMYDVQIVVMEKYFYATERSEKKNLLRKLALVREDPEPPLPMK
ncbi:hypothetical protein [Mesorhizobium sp. A556]